MTRKVYIVQEGAGDDGLYHWKIMLHGEDPKGSDSIWYDVIWSDKKEEGMIRRGPKPFDAAKSREFIKAWPIGDLPAATALKDFKAAAEAAYRPQYKAEDKDLNCQTWTLDVVSRLLGKNGLKAAEKVPKEEDDD